MRGRIGRGIVAAALAAGLGGCMGAMDSSLFEGSFWDSSPLISASNDAQWGIGALSLGDQKNAEEHFNKALKRNPKDVHALLGLGILYQNRGQGTRAREMYEAILAIRPPDSRQIVPFKDLAPVPVSEMASTNLALLESGGVLTDLGRGGAGAVPPVTAGVASPVPTGRAAVAGAPMGSPMLGRAGPPAMAFQPQGAAGAGAGAVVDPVVAEADANVISRFKTLRALRDQGLITQEEFDTRRKANVGALLPLSSPPPAAGLDRAVPGTEQISGRLRAIGRALEMRAMSVAQHASERSMILDALMPAAPVTVASASPPPQGLMQAADSVRRLEQLRDAGLIGSDEYSRERRSIEGAMQTGTGGKRGRPAGQSAPAPAPAPAPSSGKGGTAKAAVHLASFRSQEAASRGWTQIKRAHRELLGKLEADISKVDMGPGKGIFYRIKAGPLASSAAADDLCAKLKRRSQFCEPSAGNF